MSLTQTVSTDRSGDQQSRSVSQPGDRAVGSWLLVICFMILGQFVIGAITRLTGSGLSIMEWKPIIGLIPPLNEAQWNHAFDLYKETMQYKHINSDMTLAGFQGIFWWEYIHRVWARLIGFVFLLPFLWFLAKGWIRKAWRGRLITMFVLGGLQGLMGWIMVASGFEDRTSVSQYRLVAHLLLALLIYGYILWSALDLLQPAPLGARETPARGLRRHGWIMLALIVLEIGLGGFVAGLHGGLIYNNFPMMGEHFIADDLFFQSPWWINFFENPGTAQFMHRLVAMIVALTIFAFAIRIAQGGLPDKLQFRGYYLVFGVLGQIALGISTLMLVVPVSLATIHQAGAIILFSLALYALHGLKRVGSA